MTHPVSTTCSTTEMQDAGVRQKSFQLQRCLECYEFQYPARDACVNCLSGSLKWTETSDRGTILAQTSIHVSTEQYFRAKMPITTCLVKLDCGPIVICFGANKTKPGDNVRLSIEKRYNDKDVYAAVSL
ncbi:putative OB-fold protein [Ochrobactrum sp. P6BSIII]|nr:putative OB-fold protein [Ochrobactrum sp. P6BSIII]